jgi:phosphatidate cytidylyltransferase|tara:strand:+ start:2865 stop:3701 length:837 start_codon:yes stop_codon:yes gene_type:complete
MQNNLSKRIVTASIVFPIIVFIILQSNQVLFRVFLNIIIFLSAFEISKMCFHNNLKEKGNTKHYLFILLIFISILFSNILIKNNLWHYLVYFSLFLWSFVIIHIFKLKKIKIIDKFGIIYFLGFVLVLSSFYCSIYQLYLLSPSSLLFLVSLVAVADISAYFVGKKIGKNSFFAKISPNKTVEGFLGSILVSLTLTLIFCILNNYEFNFTLKFLFLSLLTVIISAFGDLGVSLIKRYSGNKDTGRILPGHGGILDRVDSILPAAPIFLTFSYFLSVII